MKKTYVVLGAGLQGLAAAYDFGRFGNAAQIIMADAQLQAAKAVAERINTLHGEAVATASQVDAANERDVLGLLERADVCLSAVPYRFNAGLSAAAIKARCHFCDLGGNTEVVFKQHALHEAAQRAGVTIAPDCGLAPGMANILAAYAIRHLRQAKHVAIHVGGLPQNPKPPLGYHLFFNIAGLTNEYFGKAHVLRNGRVTELDTFSELEQIEFPRPVGKCESFLTYGGTSTCPWTFAGKLQSYSEKTVRYPGHYDKMKAIYDLGLLDQQPVRVGDVEVVPRQLFHAVAGPRLSTNDPKDVVVLRVIVQGEEEKMVMELMDFYDQTTGFTAMQRTTGFGAAIVGIMLAMGELPPGSVRLERDVDADAYLQAVQKRGFDLKIDVSQ